ncbi:MAG: CPBP family intramembrane glutamic endopeptidase [Bacteroidota bacterium]
MMKTNVLKSTLTPIVAILLCCALYLSGYFQVIFAMLIVIAASRIEYGKGLFASLGFQRHRLKALNLLVIAPVVAAIMFAVYIFLLIPGITYLTGQPIDFSEFEVYEGNLPAILGLFVYIWVSAAFGEEILFRGYLMRQFIKFFGDGKVAIILNIVLLGALFGWIHAYQGITGQIITGIIGATTATIFYFRKYDLWFCIAIHGFFDTIALVFMYYGIS